MAPAYYNEFDPFAAAWLRELIKAGLIAEGDVDERSIKDVQPIDLIGYDQCHFFAGIGGWSYALRLAGWPDDRVVWTGSCPCQPFSAAGKRGGTSDDRHLWPEFFRLIGQCRPPIIFGEQVASKDGLAWLDLVSTDLEGAGYAVGAADLCAAGVQAPHIRQRLWFVAESNSDRQTTRRGDDGEVCGIQETECEPEHSAIVSRGSGATRQLADVAKRDGRTGERRTEAGTRENGERRGRPSGCGIDGGLGHAEQPGLEGHAGDERDRDEPGRQRTDAVGSVAETGGVGELGDTAEQRREPRRTESGRSERVAAASFWANAQWLPCRDGKARPVEPGVKPLAHGVSARVGRLRGYGNAIVPQVAAEVIATYMEIEHE